LRKADGVENRRIRARTIQLARVLEKKAGRTKKREANEHGRGAKQAKRPGRNGPGRDQGLVKITTVNMRTYAFAVAVASC